MLRTLAIAAIATLAAATFASAAVLQGGPRDQRITGTSKVDRILAGRGDDVVFARDRRADYVNCGPGSDMAVLDRIDRSAGCETRRYPPLPTTLAPSPSIGVVGAGPRGSVTRLPKPCRRSNRPSCRPPAPLPPPEPEPEPEPEPPLPPSSGPLGIPGNWTLVFSDEFSGSAVDLSKWEPNWFGTTNSTLTKGVNANETNCIDPALSTVSGGFLRMRLVAQTTDCPPWSDMPYRAALINSRETFSFTHGAYEARMFLPAAVNGLVANWPGFWSVHTSSLPEIDVMEGLGGRAYFNYHHSGGQTGPTAPAGNWIGWHTFAANWRAGRIDFYWDGAQVGSVSTNVGSTPQYLIVQNVVSRFQTGTTGVEMLTDYVRVWKPA